MRLARQGEGAIGTDGQPIFSGAKFARAMDRSLEGGPETKIMKTLFSEDELALMQQFKRVAARATIEPPGGVNWSNTSAGMSNMVQRAIALMGEGAASRFVTLPVIKAIFERSAESMARRRAGFRPQGAGMPWEAGGGGPVGAVLEDGWEASKKAR